MHTDQAFQDGYGAYKPGQKKPKCPISCWDAENHDAWMMGWLEHRDEVEISDDSENIYNLASMRQAIEEDRR